MRFAVVMNERPNGALLEKLFASVVLVSRIFLRKRIYQNIWISVTNYSDISRNLELQQLNSEDGEVIICKHCTVFAGKYILLIRMMHIILVDLV